MRQDRFIVLLRLHVYVLHIRMCSRMTHGSICSEHEETSAQKKLNVHFMAGWVGGGVSACRMENPSARDCIRATLGDATSSTFAVKVHT